MTLDNVLRDFEQVSADPTDFLKKTEIPENLKLNAKELYDFSKQDQLDLSKKSSLPKLIVKDFDLEQIWQQIELQNEEILNQSLTNVSKLIVSKNQLIFTKVGLTSNKRLNVESPSPSISENEENDDDHSTINTSSNDEASSSNEDTLEDIQVSNTKKKQKKNNTTIKESIVDDDFFKLSEMESFLNKEEKKIEKDVSNNSASEDDSEDAGSIDLFKAESTDSEPDEENDARMARFKDYYVEKDTHDKISKRNAIIMQDDQAQSENIEISGGFKSTLELRQDRLKRKIEELEEQAVSEKPWQLKGEISANNRPQNSLLEEIVEFDLTSRPAPVITEQTSLQLEDIIRQRIKDKVFDSVEKKVKPVETPLEYKKRLVLEQEKSKHSLAQIYEKEYLEQQATLDPENLEKEKEEPELHKEISSLMKNLFSKLDALSNFHFTSKPVIPELKIISNLPAINMEEVAPVAVSDATLLAPEEIKTKLKGNYIGKSERTSTDKKRERRKKKLKQKVHSQLKQKKAKLVKTEGVPKKYKSKRH